VTPPPPDSGGGVDSKRSLAMARRRTGAAADPKLLESTLGETQGSVFGSWTPPVDIEETDDAFIVEADLPEVKAEDVNVELDDNQLQIHGEIKERERTGVLRKQTRRTGQFYYRVTLPAQVQSDSVQATLKDGVLRLKLHKDEGRKPRRIEVTTG
jgi:HSP20 family protein